MIQAYNDRDIAMLDLKRLLNIAVDQPVALATRLDANAVRSMLATFVDSAGTPDRAALHSAELTVRRGKKPFASRRHRQVVDASGEPDHLDHVHRLLFPVVGAVEVGDVLEVLPDAQIVVEDRLVGQVMKTRRRGPRSTRSDDHRPSPYPGSLPTSIPVSMRSSVVLPLPL